jgi:hypothetical protein
MVGDVVDRLKETVPDHRPSGRRPGGDAGGLIVGVQWGASHLLTNGLWAGDIVSGKRPLALLLTVNGLSLLVGQLLVYPVLMVCVYNRTGKPAGRDALCGKVMATATALDENHRVSGW